MDQIRTLLLGVLDARGQVLVKLNVRPPSLDAVIKLLPSMKTPTVNELFGDAGLRRRDGRPQDRDQHPDPGPEGRRGHRHHRAADRQDRPLRGPADGASRQGGSLGVQRDADPWTSGGPVESPRSTTTGASGSSPVTTDRDRLPLHGHRRRHPHDRGRASRSAMPARPRHLGRWEAADLRPAWRQESALGPSEARVR